MQRKIEMTRQPFFTRDRSFYRELFHLTLFIALQNVIVTMVGLVDNIMIGNYSQDAMTGIGLANQIQFLLQMVIGGIAEGTVVLGSQYWGTRRNGPIRRVVSISLRFALVVGAIFMALGLICPKQLLSLLTNEPNAIREGVSYIRIMSFSYILFCCGNVLVSAQRSVENVRVAMVGSLCALLVNVVLNYALIYGRFGLPELGARGAAIATLVGRIVEFSVIAAYTLRIDKKLEFRPSDVLHVDPVLLRDYTKVAVPVMLSGLSWGLAMSIQTAILGHIDQNGTAIAANSISNTLFQVITVATYGLSSASGVVTGKAVGRDDRNNLRAYVRTMQVLFICMGLVTSLALFLLRPVVLGAYNITEEAYRMSDQFLLVLCVTVIGTAYQASCLTGIVRGGGNTKFVFYNDLIFMWGIVLPTSLLAAFVWHLNPVIVFCCLKCDQILKCAVAVWEVNSYHWVKKVARDAVE